MFHRLPFQLVVIPHSWTSKKSSKFQMTRGIREFNSNCLILVIDPAEADESGCVPCLHPPVITVNPVPIFDALLHVQGRVQAHTRTCMRVHSMLLSPTLWCIDCLMLYRFIGIISSWEMKVTKVTVVIALFQRKCPRYDLEGTYSKRFSKQPTGNGSRKTGYSGQKQA